jgi:hypothetical protein
MFFGFKKLNLASSLLLGSAFMAISSSAMAVKQRFPRPGFTQNPAYMTECYRTKDEDTYLLKVLEARPEAREFVRLMKEVSLSDYQLPAARAGYSEWSNCHTVFVPKNELLENVRVTRDNLDQIALLLRSHILTDTILEESDFSIGQTLRLRSSSGNPVDLTRSSNGMKAVNGIELTDDALLESSPHAIILLDAVLPEVKESILDAADRVYQYGDDVSGISYDGDGQPLERGYPILSNVTGRPRIKFSEIMRLCNLESRLAQGGVTILVPASIPFADAPIIGELWKSDLEFVCRAFSGNILNKAYTFNDLRELGKTNSEVTTISSRRVGAEHWPRLTKFRPEHVRIGEGRVGIGYDEDLLEVRITSEYSIFWTYEFALPLD